MAHLKRLAGSVVEPLVEAITPVRIFEEKSWSKRFREEDDFHGAASNGCSGAGAIGQQRGYLPFGHVINLLNDLLADDRAVCAVL